jgi:hypothetical protein
MANQLSLSPEQIKRLNQITSDGTTNFVEGYRYISSLIENDPSVDDYTKLFFRGAREVNGNFIADSNLFIRGLTEAGLAWDGRLKSDPVERASQIQATSDDIAKNVIRQINADKGIPALDTILQNDARTAVTYHDQTVGGWGGAFYYWNTKFTDKDKTVGEAIMADPLQLEKFIAINAQALVDTSLRQGLSPGQLMASIDAQAPWAIKQAILTRASEVIFGGGSFAGDPYNIDGYVPIVDRNERPVGWRLGGGDEITDPVKKAELNKRYDIRLRKSDDPSWQGIQPQIQIEQNPSAPVVPSPAPPSPVNRAPANQKRSAAPDSSVWTSSQAATPATPAFQQDAMYSPTGDFSGNLARPSAVTPAPTASSGSGYGVAPRTAADFDAIAQGIARLMNGAGQFVANSVIPPAEAASPPAQGTPLLRPNFPGQGSAFDDRSADAPGVPNPGTPLRRISSAFPGIVPPDPDPVPPSQPGRPLGIFTGKPMPSWTVPPPLGGLRNNSGAAGNNDFVDFLTGLLPRNPAPPEPP